MALFKILKGSAANFGATGNSTATTKEGYAYFTPDDGKFYIDVKGDQIPVIGNYEGEIGENGQEVNRICINQRLFSYNDYDVLDCGTANTATTTDTIIFNCGNSQE